LWGRQKNPRTTVDRRGKKIQEKQKKNASQFRNLEARSQSCQTSAEEVGFTGQ